MTEHELAARLQLSAPEGVEAPSRVPLGGYPNTPLKKVGHERAQAWYTGWDVPFVNIRELAGWSKEVA